MSPTAAGHPRILIVEDDEVIREATRMALERYGFPVATAADGLEGLEMFHAVRPDLVLLDVMLPLLDGVGLCRRIREESQLPILMMSARTDPVDVVSGLEAGADDYVVKPFESAVLVARIRTVLRRVRVVPAEPAPAAVAAPAAFPAPAPGLPAPAFPAPAPGLPAPEPGDVPAPPAPAPRTPVRSFDGLEVDTDSMEVRVHGTLVPLTPTELRLLLEFTAAPGIVLERAVLLERVWDYEWGADTRVVDVHVQRLRAKIGGGRIETVRGFGYKLRRAE
ncbi:DNA-binding response regulator, OmpR family, contains REC and winged-helix (wHTH) domain [Streptomyces sp. TLI_053]|uniref:response regulator transcription factor n=1 Tax=Streptomyces sp. TLI_053 TaxID=1855352 RepID=UPI00087BABBC|nr:response regulator transcription factor [Streptomyces sp. TLI_053]SDT47537.1 DNA-binding response regulator, OmpR family, contains REC and winged-helix (wHTH) domain [Streptomyces sp. TLI_053]